MWVEAGAGTTIFTDYLYLVITCLLLFGFQSQLVMTIADVTSKMKHVKQEINPTAIYGQVATLDLQVHISHVCSM